MIKKSPLSLIILFFSITICFAQPEIIQDINVGAGWSDYNYLFHKNNQFYFTANGDAGVEIWVSDGTSAGTQILKDINPGFTSSSNPKYFTEINGSWFFAATNELSGNELWKTDGTAAGTVMVKDINPGMDSSTPANFANIGGMLYFEANNGSNGFELWRSDGTSSGTTMIKDINVGPDSSSPNFFTEANGELFFVANDGVLGNELWKTDGTSANTINVANIAPGNASSFPSELVHIGDFIFLLADDGTIGRELYRTQISTGVTNSMGDIFIGAPSSSAEKLMAIGDFLFFTANNGSNGIELYRADTSPTGNLEMLELFAGNNGSAPSEFTILNGDLIFSANDGTVGFELWKANAIDGTVELLKDIYQGQESSVPVVLSVYNNEIYYSARADNIGIELWKTDGTTTGTALVADINQDPTPNISNSNPVLGFVFDNFLYFSAEDNVNGYQIWRTNGTASLTQRLTNIPHDGIFNNTHKPYFTNITGNTCLNFIGLGDPFGEELWKYTLTPIVIDTVITNSPLACFGDTNGTLNVEISGGVGDQSCFTYNWSDPAISGTTASNLPAGNYSLTVADCAGFQAISNITIVEPTLLEVSIAIDNNVLCFGENSGQATATVSGGTPSYTYAWSNGESDMTAESLTAGWQILTVTDATGCSTIDSIFMNEPNGIFGTINSGPEICFGANNGLASIVVSGGTTPYQYLWDNGDTTAGTLNLPGGNISVTIVDGNNCVYTTGSIIDQKPEIIIDFDQENVSCIDGSNGMAIASASGGSGSGYAYFWQGGSTSDTLMNLSGGAYSLTVIDSDNCTQEAVVNILTPEFEIIQNTEPTCNGGNDAQAIVVVSNGNSTYSYAWDNGENSSTPSMLSGGINAVTISDLLGCSTIESVDISEPAFFELVDTSFSATTCSGNNDGLISIALNGGTTPYTFVWSTGDTTNIGILTNLAGNSTYCVTITEFNNCDTIIHCRFIPEGAAVLSNIDNILSTSCSDSCDGQATVSATGGINGNFNYLWSSGETGSGGSSTGTMLCSGLNYVTITEGQCFLLDSIMIESPPALSIDVSTIDVLCAGTSTGSAVAVATGGTGPYDFVFSGPQDNLPAGNFTVTVTDANGCLEETSFTITEPDPLLFTGSTSPETGSNGDGSATVSGLGGVPPYTYVWNTTPTQTTETISNLSSGSYLVTITDANDCELVAAFFVDMTININSLSNLNAFDIFPNPTSQNCALSFDFKTAVDAKVIITDLTGNEIMIVERNNVTSDLINLETRDFVAGTYMVKLVANSKVWTKKIVIIK